MKNRIFHINRTIRTDLILLLSLSIILPFTVITALYITNVKKIIDNDVISYQQAIIKQSQNNLISIFDSVKIAQRATLGKVITDYITFSYDKQMQKDEIGKAKDLFEYLYVIDNANPYINGIYVIFESQYIFSSGNGVRDKLLLKNEWIDKAWMNPGIEIFTEVHSAAYNVAVERKEYDSVISFLQVFEIPQKKGEKVLLQIDIELSAFDDFVKGIENTEQIPMFFMDSTSGKVLLQNNIYIEYVNTPDISEMEVMKEIKSDYLYLYAYIRQDKILNHFSSAILGTTLIIALIVFISFFTALILSRMITAPLHELYLCMQQVGQGDFFPEYPTTQYKELAYLINRFQTMVREVDVLIDTVVKKENETTEAKLLALQAKINPHFLYNTLDVIRGLALSEGNRDISDMTLALSRLFRYNVGNLSESTDLGEELEYIHNYLQIQKFRFGDRITVEFLVPPGLENAKISRFLLQPLIENAFKYGLEIRGRGGFLKIQVINDEGTLLISVLDNGPGIQREILDNLQNSFRQNPQNTTVKETHGLDNVSLRIKMIYGNNYGLTIDSEVNLWTKVCIKIPYSTEQNHV